MKTITFELTNAQLHLMADQYSTHSKSRMLQDILAAMSPEAEQYALLDVDEHMPQKIVTECHAGYQLVAHDLREVSGEIFDKYCQDYPEDQSVHRSHEARKWRASWKRAEVLLDRAEHELKKTGAVSIETLDVLGKAAGLVKSFAVQDGGFANGCRTKAGPIWKRYENLRLTHPGYSTEPGRHGFNRIVKIKTAS
ncbi:MAG: hypothetical protein J4F41_00145 [Alphaproteobacteria bacterium]|nr:hypothetical protein [Alphaproteobacteria bacterium]